MPGATTPTWEIELLVSGAVVFSLLQMPGALDTLFQQWSPRLVAEWMTLVFLGYYTQPGVQAALGYRAHPDGWQARRRSAGPVTAEFPAITLDIPVVGPADASNT